MADKLKCLICGKKYSRPASHVTQVHGMTAREYKEKFGLDVKKGITTHEYRELMRSKHTTESLKRLEDRGKKSRFTKGHKINYTRSKQTLDRLRKQGKSLPHFGREPVEKVQIHCAECGKPKDIYPRYYQKGNNYCGVVCRNIAKNSL